ncbi:conserved hypothetical protein [Psychromonas ingrahamii 37]|uniref:DUF4126 domain-containing protein n=1 Tax=Psychromonas ingrahamii (strain DSM 17664 / CCUG 51855 / 37) TaxID=357804 RepID=A1SSH5_PSYIN|nr:DUF4126 family protein [Psychromonas ingrahamii]ABM02440.1 conserved hypothetical protein [Psychromonas ingrahamii 37]
MESYQALLATLALTMGASWASGVNLYAALLVLGLGGISGNIDLPVGLEVLENPLVIGAAGLMYVVEFFIDKTPGLDSSWDAISTFIRLPAGAMLAAGAVGDVTPALEIAAGIMGGGLAATSHATKAGTRLLINTSPEPVTNWTASITEDLLVLGGLWTALNHPLIFIILMVIFLILAIFILPKLWRLIKRLFRKMGQFLGLVDRGLVDRGLVDSDLVERGEGREAEAALSSNPQYQRLQALYDEGVLSEDEFNTARQRLNRNSESQ